MCARAFPEFAAVALPQRGFLVRAVRFMARDASIRHAHADALLSSTPQGKCAYLDADVRDSRKVLTQAAWTLDLDRPAGGLPHRPGGRITLP
ncbi:SAM-dependent methyltransferase [Streptomyces sp. 6-11-2]|uniref:SAM-dependent methyltransferase n=2 Tax=unclassified Streptomyces TaxID=2593676 RepID=UPI00114471BB|nr:SAM-dependent methyltransferase [Streptomyces sp. 6-11-2]GED89542.1 hypothetical protein TNCT6_66270 [Streptomyces sp. 6-11-2]